VNGTVWPAVCDRGDDANQIVLGYGPQSQGWMTALDPNTAYRASTRTPSGTAWFQAGDAAYNQANGETRPGCVSNRGSYEYIKAYGRGTGGQGKVDGEGYDGGGAGWWTVQSTNQAYDAANGATWTAVNEAYHATSIVTSGGNATFVSRSQAVP
jgi:hypothetical protein